MHIYLHQILLRTHACAKDQYTYLIGVGQSSIDGQSRRNYSKKQDELIKGEEKRE